jgi:hypothetical protein
MRRLLLSTLLLISVLAGSSSPYACVQSPCPAYEQGGYYPAPGGGPDYVYRSGFPRRGGYPDYVYRPGVPRPGGYPSVTAPRPLTLRKKGVVIP